MESSTPQNVIKSKKIQRWSSLCASIQKKKGVNDISPAPNAAADPNDDPNDDPLLYFITPQKAAEEYACNHDPSLDGMENDDLFDVNNNNNVGSSKANFVTPADNEVTQSSFNLEGREYSIPHTKTAEDVTHEFLFSIKNFILGSLKNEESFKSEVRVYFQCLAHVTKAHDNKMDLLKAIHRMGMVA